MCFRFSGIIVVVVERSDATTEKRNFYVNKVQKQELS
jgi:hypothetical protein